LPADVRDARRDEIASDLWHSTQDRENPLDWRTGLNNICRLMLGMPDDLGWRIERQPFKRRFLAALTAAAALVPVLVGIRALSNLHVPRVPPLSEGRAAVVVTKPPPPPPVVNSAGVPIPLHLAYGLTSYTIASGGAAPARTKEVRPVYPPVLMAAGMEGTVIVRARIAETGRVVDARVVQPMGLLGQSALDAIKQWEFEAATRSGGSGANTLTVFVRFGRADAASSRPVD
jgi:TonB family protein